LGTITKSRRPVAAKNGIKPGGLNEPPAVISSTSQLPPHAEIILNSIAEGVFTVDLDWRITFFNRAAVEITGIPAAKALGRPCCEVFRANVCESACVLRQTLTRGKPVVNKAIAILRADSREIPISISTALLKDEAGAVIGGVETFRDLSLVEELRREIQRNYRLGDIISKSPRMQELFGILPEIARSNSTVMIQGDSGTGKELVARALHSLSARASKPFVAVNCGALPDTLLESELFGHVAGAFTDARRDRLGRFALAEGGTLFLDEIGDISQALQVRLLRVLEDRTYMPLGSNRIIKTDVRVVTATHRNLAHQVEQNQFRKDLYYRLNVVQVKLPRLSERLEDIPLLAGHFIARFNRLKDKKIVGLSHDTLAIFMQHDWPGNIRELENAIEHAFILCHHGIIHPYHLPEHLRPTGREAPPLSGLTLAELEKRAIWEALVRNDWRRLATARELGIDKNTLRRKVNRFGLTAPSSRGKPGTPPHADSE
jgi:PAS domain S-box-containing protein